jgi:hypothetical protein
MSKAKILFFASNPKNTDQMNLENEARYITRTIRESKYRDLLDLVTAWAVRSTDLLEELNRHKPEIVHFSVHGSVEDGLILVDDQGNSELVSTGALKMLFTTVKDNIRLVILNACFSALQGQAISEVIECVVAMNKEIGDEAAISFATAFYSALGYGRSVQEAFDQGKTVLKLKGIPEENTPQIFCRAGVDPNLLQILPYHESIPDDVTILNKSLRVLGDMIINDPAVRDTVRLSEDKLKNASVQIDELEFFKTIHDALHDIEHDCLQPMIAANTVDGLKEYKDSFDEASNTINDAIEGREMSPLLQNLRDRLKGVSSDFEAVIAIPGDAAFVKVVSGLNGLISKVPPRLDGSISDSAKKLNLNNLVDLLTQVRVSLSEEAGSGLFVQSIEALPKIRDELAKLVSKHHPLQSLDYNVRTVCVAEAIPADLASEWEFIKLERSRLVPMGELDRDLTKIESAINEAIIKNNQSDIMDYLKAYLARVSKEFRKVDKELKKLCLNLGRVNQPLQAVLELCKRG